MADKFCRQCGKKLVLGKGENQSHMERKKYCSRECYGKAKKAKLFRRQLFYGDKIV